MDQMRQVSIKLRFLLLAVAWTVTALMAMLIAFPNIQLMLVFLVGMFFSTERFFGHTAWFTYMFSPGREWIGCSVACFLYIALTICGLLLRRQAVYFAVYAILCLLLILGLKGLYEFAHWKM